MKYLAALFMLIDHIGMVFYPTNMIYRIIGRLAMPIFAYGIAMGFMKTSSLKKYVIRLSIFTIISQPVFAFMQYSVYKRVTGVNIGATFLIAIGCLVTICGRGLREKKVEEIVSWQKDIKDTVIRLIILSSLLVLSEILNCDYGIYGVLVVMVFYVGITIKKDNVGYLGFAIITIIYSLTSHSSIQLFSILSIVLIPYTKNKVNYIPRYFFYIFYPLHMLVIALAKMSIL